MSSDWGFVEELSNGYVENAEYGQTAHTSMCRLPYSILSEK